MNIINEYIKKECQVKGQMVKLDPFLTSLCPNIKEVIEVKNEEIDLLILFLFSIKSVFPFYGLRQLSRYVFALMSSPYSLTNLRAKSLNTHKKLGN